MVIIDSIAAPFKGVQLCFGNPSIRKLALKPWLIGVVSYLAAAVTAFYAHPVLLNAVRPHGDTFWTGVLSLLAWLGVTLGLLFGTVVATVLIVLACGAYYHSQISLAILKESGVAVRDESLGQEVGRTILTESLKLLWLVPLFVISFILGLIPVLAPFAFVFASLLLAYQFFDYPLEVVKLGAFKRFGFILSHPVPAIAFGGTLFLLGMIPFAAFFIAPAAVAGASWLFVAAGWSGEKQLAASTAIKETHRR